MWVVLTLMFALELDLGITPTYVGSTFLHKQLYIDS